MSAFLLFLLFTASTHMFSEVIYPLLDNPSHITEVLAERTVQATSPTTAMPIPTLTPTVIPGSLFSPTPAPEVTQTSLLKPTVSAIENTSATTNKSVDDYLLDKVNEYRASQGLPLVSSNSQTCNFASLRAWEISLSFNHDGFRQRLDNNTLPYPSYSVVTENIAMNFDYTKVVEKWILSKGHAENMRQDTPFVCIRSQGDYYAYVGWKP